MALSSHLPKFLSLPPLAPSLQGRLMRLATACAAIVGLSSMANQAAAGGGLTFENGTYLYGDSPTAGTIGATYFVFKVEAGTLSGAMYQPLSSFDCVRGRVGQERLQLTVVDAYDQTERPYSLAFTAADAPIASAQPIAQLPEILGMHPIRTLSELDHQLLAVCL